jgi:hypothetical protein
MYLKDKIKWITMKTPLYQKSRNFKCDGYILIESKFENFDSLHAKQAQMGGRGINRSVIFAERAQCHKGHWLLIISKVFIEVKFTI